MNLNLKNKVIVISEGATAVTEGIASLLANEGAVPVIIKRNEDDKLKALNTIESSAEKYFQFYADLTKPDECEKAIQQILKKFGNIDGLINDFCVTRNVALTKASYEDFVAGLNENIIPYYLITHYALPALKKLKGVILNVISVNDTATNGETALTREWAVELLKYNIRVNAVVVQNGNTTPEEIANTVAFLISDKSTHTTGQLIHVDAHTPRQPFN